MTTATSGSGVSDTPTSTVPLISLKAARYSVDELRPMLKGKLFEVEGTVSPETAGQVEKLLRGQKTDLMVFPDGTAGKLFVIQEKDKNPVIHQQDARQNLYIPTEYMGHKFNQADFDNLRHYGNMGRRVELTDQFSKKPMQAFIGVDKDMKTLKVVKAEKFNVPTKLLGVSLTEAQQEKLREGKSVRIDMMQKDGKEPFSAYVRYHAGEGKLTYDRTPTPAQRRVFASQTNLNTTPTTGETQTSGGQDAKAPIVTPHTPKESSAKAQSPSAVKPAPTEQKASTGAKGDSQKKARTTQEAGKPNPSAKTAPKTKGAQKLRA